MITCCMLTDDRIACGREIVDPKPWNFGEQCEEGLGVCDTCLGIGEIEDKPEPPEFGLFKSVWLRQIEPTQNKKSGEWYAHYEIDSRHYYMDRREIAKDDYDDMLAIIQQ